MCKLELYSFFSFTKTSLLQKIIKMINNKKHNLIVNKSKNSTILPEMKNVISSRNSFFLRIFDI